MGGLGPETWMLVAAVIGVTVLTILHASAQLLQAEHHRHDLRVRVDRLRREHLEQLKQQREEQAVVTSLELPGINAATASEGAGMIPAGAKAAGPKKK